MIIPKFRTIWDITKINISDREFTVYRFIVSLEYENKESDIDGG
jgi:hypothetical protein